MWLCVDITSFYALKKWNLRLLHIVALPFALIILYSPVHAIPRYQTVSYAGFSVAAGVGLSILLTPIWSRLSLRLS